MIQRQRNDSESAGSYCYLKDPGGIMSVNAAMFKKRSQSLKLIDVLLFYSKHVNSRDDLRYFIPAPLCKATLKEFHDNSLATQKEFVKLMPEIVISAISLK